MKNYEKFREEMMLRDYLAVDRTLLAVERTLLTYIRTGLGTLATGAGLIRFTESTALILTGYIILGISPIICIFGAYRFREIRKNIKKLYDQIEEDSINVSKEDLS